MALLHEACMGVQVWILVHDTLGCPSNFFCTKVRGRGGGESKQILREYGFKKTSKIRTTPYQSEKNHEN